MTIPTPLDDALIVDGARLSYLDKGEGEPVVFIHGTPSHSFIWRNVLPIVAAGGYRVLAYDMLGFGTSERPIDRDTSVKTQAALLPKLLDALQLDRVNLIAHDIGGAVAQIFAVAAPERIRRMMLVDSVSYDSWPSPTWRTIIDQRLRTHQTMTAAEFDAMLTQQLTMTVADSSRMSEDVLAAYVAPYRSELGRWSFFEHQVRHYDSAYTQEIAPELARLTMPVSIVWGARDQWQPTVYAYKLSADIPTAKLTIVDDAGHFLMEDAPERVAEEALVLLEN